jgi:[acyl-carrier-protein] S-malonyltransferase
MGKALAEAHPDIKTRYFDRADEILGFPISQLCFEGPDDELVKTENQQPAIFLVSCALDDALRQLGIGPEAVAGHSLGEYSALVAAGAFSFEDGLRLTRRRGELMAQVAAKTGGIMAAIIGLPAEAIEGICREASSEGLAEVANFNSPLQTVISGEESGIQRAMELAREQGATRVVQLNVSAPFHCSLMDPLAREFAPVLDGVQIADPQIPVVANVTAAYERSAQEVKQNLITQLASSVRWTASMERLIADGYDTFVEVGPGRVLGGLMRQIDPNVTALQTQDAAGVAKAVEALGAGA